MSVRLTKRDKSGNMNYPQEHTKPDVSTAQSLLPNSRMFEDTTRTLGVASRGFHFTGQTTDNEYHDAAIHSSRSLLFDDRQDSENFVPSRNGAQSNPAFKDYPSPDILGPNPSGVEFTPSTAEPPAQGQGGAGPSWWHRIITNFRGVSTQSTNAGVKPPEKYELGLRSSNQKITSQPRPLGVGPEGVNQGVTLQTGAPITGAS